MKELGDLENMPSGMKSLKIANQKIDDIFVKIRKALDKYKEDLKIEVR